MTSISPEIWDVKERIREEAEGRWGLDFFETIFEVVDYKKINELAAYGGFPTRYPHWRFGMEYEQLSRSAEYGLSKIYEMVLNNDPSYAYLLEGNHMVDQKTVIAHVYGHVDFFKNNYYFSKTNRRMIDEMANHAARVRRYIDRKGIERVEDFIDTCLSVDNLIDYFSPFIVRERAEEEPQEFDPEELAREQVPRFEAKDYMESYINPESFLEAQRKKLEAEAKQRQRFPERAERDVMGFLLEHAPLEGWEADLLSMVSEEAYYFAPQGQTKIMNEGWASYWHETILTHGILDPSEFIDFADMNSRVLSTSPGQLNPYALGVALYRDIEERWNTGRFGKEWEQERSLERRVSWNKELGLGREKIFEVRKLHNDVSFIDEFLTEDFARRHKMFSYIFNKKSNQWEIESREFQKIKNRLLDQLTNFGQPFIYVVDGNYKNRGELLLHHDFQSVELRTDYARGVLKALQRLWKRPVSIQTKLDNKGALLTYDGKDHSEKAIDYQPL